MDPTPTRTGLDPLTAWTVGLLALPWLLFAGGWLRPLVALPVLVMLPWACWRLVVSRPRTEADFVDRRLLAVAAGLGLAWVSMSGIGGLGYQNLIDWDKHNAVLRLLITEPWPPSFDAGGGTWSLVYYVGWYLLPALAGSVAGWLVANLTAVLLSWLGVTLALLWVERLTGRGGWLVIPAFVVAGGWDVVGELLVHGWHWFGTANIEDWAGAWQYSAPTSALFWVPQHALAGWLGAALILDRGGSGRSARGAWLVVALAALWSAFAALGLAVLAGLVTLIRRGRGLLSPVEGGATLLLMGLAASFFSASVRPGVQGWVWTDPGFAGAWPILAAFLVLELAVVAWAGLGAWKDRERGWTWLWWGVVAALLVLPFYRMGLYNDLCMRASIPLLFVLWLAVLSRLNAPGRWRAVVVLLVGSLAAGTAAVRSATAEGRTPVVLQEAPTLQQLPRPIRDQYRGDPEAFFFRALARRSDTP